jgi:CelD/BcsL family acetyltransferase involved in cellulose biosynthesis
MRYGNGIRTFQDVPRTPRAYTVLAHDLQMIATDSPTAERITQEDEGVCVTRHFDQLNPLTDSRWLEFLRWQPRASVFHSEGWLRALQQTYGYEPIVFTSSLPGQPLRDAAVFCEVKSWLVRPRLVSLPFSDHTEPLIASKGGLVALTKWLQRGVKDGRWTSIEFRAPRGWGEWPGFRDGQQFILHNLNLQPSLETLFAGLNKDSTQRKIRRAAREQLRYQEGRSEELLQLFFRLVVVTRRRKALPPPPLAWFRNVLQHLGDQAKIRVARTKQGEPAGAILTLSYKGSMLFKYGASDTRFHNLGTMPFLLWSAIEDAKATGATTFDFGRSDVDHHGLIRFKDHFGAQQRLLKHKVFPADAWEASAHHWKMSVAKKIFERLPDRAMILAGRLLYPHIG